MLPNLLLVGGEAQRLANTLNGYGFECHGRLVHNCAEPLYTVSRTPQQAPASVRPDLAVYVATENAPFVCGEMKSMLDAVEGGSASYELLSVVYQCQRAGNKPLVVITPGGQDDFAQYLLGPPLVDLHWCRVWYQPVSEQLADELLWWSDDWDAMGQHETVIGSPGRTNALAELVAIIAVELTHQTLNKRLASNGRSPRPDRGEVRQPDQAAPAEADPVPPGVH